MKILTAVLLSFLFINCSTATGDPSVDRRPNTKLNPERKEVTYRFAVISDLNKSFGSTTYDRSTKNAVKFILDGKNKIDFIISAGDMVAGQKKNLNYKAMWEGFHNTVTRPLKRNGLALYPSPGNHDASGSFLKERKHYHDTWISEDILPVNQKFNLVEGVEHDFPFSYAFTIGSALFIALDATDVKPINAEDMEWLEKVLELEKDKKHKFIYGHVPLLPFAFKRETEFLARGNLSFLQRLEKILEDNKVSVYFTGHSHVYYPGQRSGSTKYISVPLLGSGARHLIQKKGYGKASQKGFLIVEYSDNGDLKIESLKSSDFSIIKDSSLPAVIDMPTGSPKYCKGCGQFPHSMFINQSKRIIYKRRSL